MKSQIGHFAAPNPAITPPINNGSSSRSHLGVNHPVLALLLYPIMSFEEFKADLDEHYVSFSSRPRDATDITFQGSKEIG
jgi:hypothetical protein